MPLNLTWVDLPSVALKVTQVRLSATARSDPDLGGLAFSCTKSYPGQVKRHCLPFQVEAALKYLVVPLTFAHDCTSVAVAVPTIVVVNPVVHWLWSTVILSMVLLVVT